MEEPISPEPLPEIRAEEPKAHESPTPKRLTPRQKKMIAIAAAIVIPLAALFYFKSVFIAAVVDGSSISRLRIVQELERQGGRDVLDGLIVEQLIANEASEKGATVSEQEVTEELDKIKAGVTDAGGTFEAALAERGFTEESLRKSITTQLIMKKLIADKLTVTDEELNEYISESGIPLPEEGADAMKEQIKAQIADGKFSEEARKLIDELRAKADITYYVNY